MLTLLHGARELDGTSSDYIHIRFKPDGIYPEPTRMTVSVPVARFLAAQFSCPAVGDVISLSKSTSRPVSFVQRIILSIPYPAF